MKYTNVPFVLVHDDTFDAQRYILNLTLLSSIGVVCASLSTFVSFTLVGILLNDPDGASSGSFKGILYVTSGCGSGNMNSESEGTATSSNLYVELLFK